MVDPLRTRTIGVEEELLLVDPTSGEPISVASLVLRRVLEQPGPPDDEPGGTVERELQQEQIETDTHPRADLSELAAEIDGSRLRVAEAARQVGARLAALASSPLPVTPRTTSSPRYLAMAERFGLTAAEQLTCGAHVHVAVQSPDEAIAVLDRIRPWLPVLTAVSANSPYWQGEDSDYASFRSQVWNRWPSAGPLEPLGSAQNYRRLVRSMLASNVLLDEAMLYFDARPSARYPTLEVRVADVPLRAADTVLIAALVRGLVETAAQAWQAGTTAPQIPAPVLRMASWQASRQGVTGELVHPQQGTPEPAATVLNALVSHVGQALRQAGDLDLVRSGVERVLTEGTGADQQRAVVRAGGELADVVQHAVSVTTMNQ